MASLLFNNFNIHQIPSRSASVCQVVDLFKLSCVLYFAYQIGKES